MVGRRCWVHDTVRTARERWGLSFVDQVCGSGISPSLPCSSLPWRWAGRPLRGRSRRRRGRAARSWSSPTRATRSGRYYAEILRAEGLNEFAVTSKANLSAPTLAGYQVVLLAQTSVTDAQAALLNGWVQGGGNLIAMRPDAPLAGLLGLGSETGVLDESYIKVATGSPPGRRDHRRDDAVPRHGRPLVDGRRRDRGDALLRRRHGHVDSRGDAAQRRRGRWAGGRLHLRPRPLGRRTRARATWAWRARSATASSSRTARDDLFLPGLAPGLQQGRDPAGRRAAAAAGQPHHADDARPHAAAALLVPASRQQGRGRHDRRRPRDEHGDGRPVRPVRGRPARRAARSRAGSACARRPTSSRAVPLTDADATAFEAKGFEIALHLGHGLHRGPAVQRLTRRRTWTPTAAHGLAGQVAEPDRAGRASRTHCIVWSDWSSEPEVELQHGIRFDTNYYYWPEGCVQNTPGLFTGSGFPMRFADRRRLDDRRLPGNDPAHRRVRPDIADGVPGAARQGARAARATTASSPRNMHTDSADHAGADAIVEEARARGVPIVSAVQMLDLARRSQRLVLPRLELRRRPAALQRRPCRRRARPRDDGAAASPAGELTQVVRNGAPVSVDRRTVKGIDYAIFDSSSGDYIAAYGGATIPPPATSTSTATGRPASTGTGPGQHRPSDTRRPAIARRPKVTIVRRTVAPRATAS